MNIYDTKPIVVPTWELKLIIEMGMFRDDNWIPTPDVTPFGFEVYYNDAKLDISSDVIGEYCFEMPDTDTTTNHELKMVVTNSHWEHLLRCRVFVEDLDIGYIIEETGVYVTNDNVSEHGTDLLGCNGHQVVPISTPIYKWLLTHKKNVLSKNSTIK